MEENKRSELTVNKAVPSVFKCSAFDKFYSFALGLAPALVWIFTPQFAVAHLSDSWRTGALVLALIAPLVVLVLDIRKRNFGRSMFFAIGSSLFLCVALYVRYAQMQ